MLLESISGKEPRETDFLQIPQPSAAGLQLLQSLPGWEPKALRRGDRLPFSLRGHLEKQCPVSLLLIEKMQPVLPGT